MAGGFDLTTKDGITEAASFLKGELPWLLALGPLGYGLKVLLEDISADKQVETAERLIQKGKDVGAKQIEFTVDRGIEGRIAVPIEGVKLDCSASYGGKTHVRVTY